MKEYQVVATLVDKEVRRVRRYNPGTKIYQTRTRYELTFQYEDLQTKISDRRLYDQLELGDDVNAILQIQKNDDGNIVKRWLRVRY